MISLKALNPFGKKENQDGNNSNMSKPNFYNDLSIPIIAAPLFLISGPKLVIECCKNGIVGTFPALNHLSLIHI